MKGSIMELENIIFNKANKIATITLNRPKFLNALCDQLIKEINYVLDLLSIGLSNRFTSLVVLMISVFVVIVTMVGMF